MFLGFSGVELALIISGLFLLLSILSGYPVAFAIAGSSVLSFLVIALLNEAGLLYVMQEHNGVMEKVGVFERGWEQAIKGTVSTWSSGIFSRAFGGNVETLLAVPLFVLMGIALEKSRIAEDLLTTVGALFGGLPGGLAVTVVLVGTLLAASTGVVGATVVTMGLISLPTMLRAGYSKELATGVIATAGTLGQIIPPSIVIVLLGSIVGDMYSIGQEDRAREAGVTVLELLGEPAVLSTGTLFKAAFIPGVVLSMLYAAYALGFAILNPSKAPPIPTSMEGRYDLGAHYGRNPYLQVAAVLGPIFVLVVSWILLAMWGVVGAQRVSETASDAVRSAEFLVPPVSTGSMALIVIAAFLLLLSMALRPAYAQFKIVVGLVGVVAFAVISYQFVGHDFTGGQRFFWYVIPMAMIFWGLSAAMPRLSEVDVIRVAAPPVILIVAVLGSILGGITSPTPAAGLGAAGAIMLAASKQVTSIGGRRVITLSALSIIALLFLRVNFDLRMGLEVITTGDQFGIWAAIVAYHLAIFGLLYSCWVLISRHIMQPVMQETLKVTAMVFLILIGSLFLSLTVRSYGGEEYIRDILRSFEDPRVLLLVVMAVLFVMGFVLDFIEIIFIVIPIVGPVIYAADPAMMPPEWITILIAVNLQTSFITPPFGFALFYLRGVAPPGVTTAHIYRGIIPFVIIQVIGLTILWFFPEIVTFLPDLLPEN